MIITEEELKQYLKDTTEIEIIVDPMTFQPMVHFKSKWTIEAVQDYQAGSVKDFEAVLVEVMKEKFREEGDRLWGKKDKD